MFNLAVLYVEYDNKKYPHSWDILQCYLKEFKTDFINLNILRINNKEEYINEYSLIYSESYKINILNDINLEWEFSGWQFGINYLKQYNTKIDAILCVNDSFVTNNYFLNRRLFQLSNLQECIFNNTIIGKVDDLYWNPDNKFKTFEIDDKDVHSWIRTNVFYMPYDIANNISFVSVKNYKNYKNPDSVAYYLPDIFEEYKWYDDLKNMSDDLKLNIHTWILSKWHSKLNKLTEENYEFFKSKCLAVINEKLFTYQLKEKNYKILNVDNLK